MGFYARLFSGVPEGTPPVMRAEFLFQFIAEGWLIADGTVQFRLPYTADAGDDGRHGLGFQRELQRGGG